MNKLIGALIIILILIILVVAFSFWKVSQSGEVEIATDRTEYTVGDVLRVKIENSLKKSICFSTCFPYYFERKNGKWESYQYSDCLTANLVDSCVASKGVKDFETILPSIGKGIYRLAIPVCIECREDEPFEDEEWFYSKEFIIR